MRVRGSWGWIAVLAIAGCGGGNDQLESQSGEEATILSDRDNLGGENQAAPNAGPSTANTPLPANTDTASGAAKQVQLQGVGGASASGSVTLMPMGAETQLALLVRGAPAGSSLPTHIHRGTCATGGPVLAPLQNVSIAGDGTGTANSTVTIAPQTLLNGSHYVQAHDAAGKPLVCGDIPATDAARSEPQRGGGTGA